MTVDYTTDPIESPNSRFRKAVKGKGVFPTEIVLSKALYLACGRSREALDDADEELAGDHGQVPIFFQERRKAYFCLSPQPGALAQFSGFFLNMRA